MLKKNKTLNIRVTDEKYKELQKWADKLNIKLGPFCLFILMEKLETFKNYADTANFLKSLDNSK
jgi:effector-binding domain-containing protein